MLVPEQRTRLVQELDRWMTTSLVNYHAALQNTRMELLLQKDSGWDFATELVVGALSTVLLAGIGPLAVKAMRGIVRLGVATGSIGAEGLESAVAASQAVFMGGVRQLVSAAKVPLKARLAGYSQQVADKILFITELQDSASSVFSRIVERAELGDDVELVLAHATLDPERLTVGAFHDQIDDALSRYESSHLDQLGPTKTGPVTDGERRVVQFVHGQVSRLAVVELRQVKHLGTSRGDDWFTPGGTRFLNWVDDDLSEAARTAQARHGTGKIESIDLEKDSSWVHVPQVWSWQFGGAA